MGCLQHPIKRRIRVSTLTPAMSPSFSIFTLWLKPNHQTRIAMTTQRIITMTRQHHFFYFSCQRTHSLQNAQTYVTRSTGRLDGTVHKSGTTMDVLGRLLCVLIDLNHDFALAFDQHLHVLEKLVQFLRDG